MSEEIKENKKTEVAKKRSKAAPIIITVFIFIIVIGAVVFMAWRLNTATNAPAAAKTSAPQEQIDLSVVSGTGVIEADYQHNVAATVLGEILSAPFEEGDLINQGALLYRIDSGDLTDNIEKSRIGLERNELTYNQNQDNINKLSIRAGISGTIKNLYISNGNMLQTAQQNPKIADIVDDSVMVLKVPFLENTASEIYVGQHASVTIVGTFYTVDGTVKKVTSGHMVSADGSKVKIVEINVPNPGTLNLGDKGTALIGNIACNDAGTFDYSATETVIAEVGGKVENLTLSVGDHVNQNDILVKLTNDTLLNAQQQNTVAIKEARLGLEILNNKLKDYQITSNITGTVIKKNLKQGDIVAQGNASPLAVVADLSKIIFKMKVDELDIAKIAAGQLVEVTTEAFPGKTFAGTVESINTTGTQVSGVALYDVKVVVSAPEGLMPGMNVSAKIKIN